MPLSLGSRNSVHCIFAFLHSEVCPRADTAELSPVGPFPYCCLKRTVPYSYTQSQSSITAVLPSATSTHSTEGSGTETGALPHPFLLLCWSLCASIFTVSTLPCTWVIYFLTRTLCWLSKIVISEFYSSLPRSGSGSKCTIFCSHQSWYTTHTFGLIALYNTTLGLARNMAVCKDSFVCAALFIN